MLLAIIRKAAEMQSNGRPYAGFMCIYQRPDGSRVSQVYDLSSEVGAATLHRDLIAANVTSAAAGFNYEMLRPYIAEALPVGELPC